MSKRYYLALNGCSSPALLNNKQVYYCRTPFWGSERFESFSEEEMIEKTKGLTYVNGWLEHDAFFVVNASGRQSDLFATICQL